MLDRRTFLAAGAATVAFAPQVESKTTEYDPLPQIIRIKKQFEPGQLLVLTNSYYLYFVT